MEPDKELDLTASVMRLGGREGGRGPEKWLKLRSRVERKEREERDGGMEPEKEL